jgi:hypothetical protein
VPRPGGSLVVYHAHTAPHTRTAPLAGLFSIGSAIPTQPAGPQQTVATWAAMNLGSRKANSTELASRLREVVSRIGVASAFDPAPETAQWNPATAATKITRAQRE